MRVLWLPSHNDIQCLLPQLSWCMPLPVMFPFAPLYSTLLVPPRVACVVSSLLCSLYPPPPSTLLVRPSHVLNTLCFAPCPC